MKSERLPDWVFDSVCEITPQWLKEQGLRGVLADLDNTLAKHGKLRAGDNVSNWIKSLRNAGIPLVIISNNSEKRVSLFCKQYDLPFISKSKKPSPRSLLETARSLGLTPAETAMIGDQIFTDVTAAKRAGMTAIIVKPLSKNIFFSVRRLVEYRYIRRIKRKRG